ncbi:MAG: hypothetical protein AAGJ52_08820 [Pseudomonadota bacterium]
MTNLIRLSIAAGVLLFLSGCASITTGQDQTLSIITPSCPGATCELVNKDGTFFVNETPGTVLVNRACGELSIRCSLEGHEDTLISVGSSVKAMTFGNIIFGGIIGVGVDAATGAACQYPSLIPVPMECGNAAAQVVVEPEAMSPELAEAVEELACNDVYEIGEGPDASLIYTSVCEDGRVLFTCADGEDCQVSEYELASEADVDDEAAEA